MLYFYKVVYLYRTYSVLYVTNYAHKKNIFDQIKNTKNPPKTNLDMYQIQILSAMATSLSHNLQDFNGSI